MDPSNNLAVFPVNGSNAAFTTITGYEPEDVIGKTPRILSSDRQDRYFYEVMWYVIKETGMWEGEIWNKRKNGEIYPEIGFITQAAIANGGVEIENTGTEPLVLTFDFPQQAHSKTPGVGKR